MAKEIKRLAGAIAAKAEVESFLSNLKKLRTDGSISEEQFAELKEEYNQRLSAAKSEITEIRNELKYQLEAKQRDQKTYEWELGKLEAKYKVGELPVDKYVSQGKKVRATAQALEAECKELTRLIKANSVAALGATTSEQQVPASKLPPLTKVTELGKQFKPSRGGRQELISPVKTHVTEKKFKLSQFNLVSVVGGVLLLISVFLPWIAASEALGTGLDSDSGRDVSGIIGLVGILGGLIIIGSAFLPMVKLRSILQTIIGIGALLALGYLIISGALPLLSKYARTLFVIREGFYLYSILAVALIVISSLERRDNT